MKFLICAIFALTFLRADIFDGVKSIRADFVETIHGERGAMDVVYRGCMIASIDNKTRWIYSKPNQKEIYVKNNEVIIYEPMINQVTIMKQNSGDLHFIKLVKQLKQKDKNTYYGRINNTDYTLYIKNNLPFKLEYKEPLGNKVEFEFSNIIKNKSEDAHSKSYDFEIPKNADIVHIDESKKK